MSNKSNKFKVRLTNLPPVMIDKADWPCIACAEEWPGEHKFQANQVWEVEVRRHADGRTLIFGTYDTNLQGGHSAYAGYLEPAGTSPAYARPSAS